MASKKLHGIPWNSSWRLRHFPSPRCTSSDSRENFYLLEFESNVAESRVVDSVEKIQRVENSAFLWIRGGQCGSFIHREERNY